MCSTLTDSEGRRNRDQSRGKKPRSYPLGTESVFCTLPPSSVRSGIHFSLRGAPCSLPTMPTIKMPQHLSEMGSQLTCSKTSSCTFP